MPIKAKYARMRSAAQVHVQQSKQDTGPDKASHTESPRVEVSAGGVSAGSGSRSNTIFDIFMSIQRIYQVVRLRRLEFVLFVSSFCCCCCCCCFCGRHEMEFRAHKVRRRPRRPNPLMPRGACFAPAHRQHNEEGHGQGQGLRAMGYSCSPDALAVAMAMASSACQGDIYRANIIYTRSIAAAHK